MPQLLFSGGLAGTISAVTVTPADVIKTRLQMKNSPYRGIVDCGQRIVREEGVPALWKGSVPRMMIITPLFAITLTVYEVMKGLF